MTTIYGNIYTLDGTTIDRLYIDEVRRNAGNLAPHPILDAQINAQKVSSSEYIERATRKRNIQLNAENVELYNLMSEAVNLKASINIMTPMLDKQEIRKINIQLLKDIIEVIKETEFQDDPVKEESSSVISSDYETSAFGESDSNVSSLYVSTKFARGGGNLRYPIPSNSTRG
jgi:hypothetical protein